MKLNLFKRMTALALASVMMIGATGCFPSGNNSTTAVPDASGETTTAGEVSVGDSQEPVTIRFSWWGGDSRHRATEEAVQAFMEEYPWITVENEYGAWDGWTEKVATQLSGGTAPDLMQVNWNWLYQFSSDGSRFADLEQFADLNLSNYPDNVLADTFIGGKQQAIPIGTTGKCFFWNKSTFDKAGIPVPSTWAELIEAGTVFKEQLGDDFYPLAMYEYERIVFMRYYLEGKYGKHWVENNELQYTVEEVKDGLDFIQSLEDAHVLPSIAQLKGDGANILEKNPKWINGTYAGFYEWDSTQAKMKDALEGDQEFVLGEFFTDGEFDAGLTKVSQCFAITETSNHKAEAALLLEFLINNDKGIEILSTERGMLANTHANEVLLSLGKLEGLTFEANQAVMKVANFIMDPNFEHSSLKDSTGVYYEVFEGLSAGQDSGELAQYLVDSINEVYAANAF
jgi:ABC-type sugar transport system, periplasmic component